MVPDEISKRAEDIIKSMPSDEGYSAQVRDLARLVYYLSENQRELAQELGKRPVPPQTTPDVQAIRKMQGK